MLQSAQKRLQLYPPGFLSVQHNALTLACHRIILRIVPILTGKNRLLATILFLAWSWLCFAGECSNPTVSLNSVGQDLTVRRDIRAEDIEVRVDGKQTKVVSLTLSSSPGRVVLMVDTSRSMNPSIEGRGWGIALRTALIAFYSVPSNASVALVTFGSKTQGQSDGFLDRQEVGRRVVGLAKQEPAGSTALFDSIDRALSVFQGAQLGDAIYLVTDGGDNKSKVSIKELKEKLVDHGVRIFVFLVPHGEFMSVEEEEGQSQMQDLAEYTGGYVIRIPWREIAANEQEWLTRAATQIGSQLQEMYRVELDISTVAGLKGHLKVSFTGRKQGSKTLVYPHQLAPCIPVP